ncbi:hypothetical protein [Actinacidiphila sp. DG2A-62]|uniref:hypothetical protein n=1 Tax=Actinacidiphila sp. DG2A-62 TaxID=3108821 RepID=UPI003FA3B887
MSAPGAATCGGFRRAGVDAPPLVEPLLRSGMPIRSAASWSHCGGLSRKDVASRSSRCGGSGTASCGCAPYSSSYRRISSPIGSAGHKVASPLSRAMITRTSPSSDSGPPSRDSDHTTKPRSNSRTRISRVW